MGYTYGLKDVLGGDFEYKEIASKLEKLISVLEPKKENELIKISVNEKAVSNVISKYENWNPCAVTADFHQLWPI